MGSTLQCDGDMNTKVNKMTQWGRNDWRKMSGALCDKRVPPHVKENIHKMIVQQLRCPGWRQCQRLAHTNRPHIVICRDQPDCP